MLTRADGMAPLRRNEAVCAIPLTRRYSHALLCRSERDFRALARCARHYVCIRRTSSTAHHITPHISSAIMILTPRQSQAYRNANGHQPARAALNRPDIIGSATNSSHRPAAAISLRNQRESVAGIVMNSYQNGGRVLYRRKCRRRCLLHIFIGQRA